VLEVLGGVAVAAVIAFEAWRATVSDHTLAISAVRGRVAAGRAAVARARSLNAALQEGLSGLSRVFSVSTRNRVSSTRRGCSAAAGHGHVRFRPCRVRLSRRTGGIARSVVRGLAGPDGGPGRPSGAGKSTALALIPRLQDATRVRHDRRRGRARVTLASLRDSIAYVGQDALLFDDTVAANILMGRPARVARRSRRRPKPRAPRISSPRCPWVTRHGSGRAANAVGRATPADFPGARAAARSACAAAGRGDQRARRRERGRGAGGADGLRAGRTTIVIAHRLSTVRDAEWWWRWRRRGGGDRRPCSLLAANGLYARLVRSQSLDAAHAPAAVCVPFAVARHGGAPSRDMAGAPSPDMAGAPSRDMAGAPSPDMAGAPSRDVVGAPSRDVLARRRATVVGAPSRDVVGAPSRDVVGAPSRDAKA